MIIPTFSLGRWQLLVDAVTSVEAQTCPPRELIVCVDHNPELLERCEQRWGATTRSTSTFPIRLIANRFDQDERGIENYDKAHGSRRRFGAGSARVIPPPSWLVAKSSSSSMTMPAQSRTGWSICGALRGPSHRCRRWSPMPQYETGDPGGFRRTLTGYSVARTRECRNHWRRCRD